MVAAHRSTTSEAASGFEITAGGKILGGCCVNFCLGMDDPCK
jgi:hypothetical protein